MEEWDEDCFEFYGIDEDYEFDAPQFHDFTREEFDSEIEENDRWFEFSGDYPPSPFIVKLNLENVLSSEHAPSSSEAKCRNRTKSTSSSSRTARSQSFSTSKRDAKGKSPPMPDYTKQKLDDKLFLARSSSFMKPTASHLAKQKKVLDNHSIHVCKRLQKKSGKLDQKGLQSPTKCDNLTTKRQKLEIGYLKKGAHLKHQVILMHKLSKKVTIPKEPELETQRRALSQRSKSSCASSESGKQKQKGCTFKARPLNKKFIQASITQPKKNMFQQPEFPDPRFSTDNMMLESPPTEQFSELSLRSSGNDTKYAPHLSNNTIAGNALADFAKDAHISFEPSFWAGHARSDQCEDSMRALEPELWSNMTRLESKHMFSQVNHEVGASAADMTQKEELPAQLQEGGQTWLYYFPND